MCTRSSLIIKLLITGVATVAPLSNVVAQSAQPGAAESSTNMPLSAGSIYQLDSVWTRDNGDTLALRDLAGRPVVMILFYGTCRHACPILFRNAQQIEAAMSDAARAETRFVMVTIDPAQDSLEDLQALAADYQLDPTRWYLLRGDDAQTRELAAVLNVQYRGQADGQISHSNVISLLNEGGEIVHRTEGLNRPVQPIVSAIEALLPQ
jgi:protein SCO1/2